MELLKVDTINEVFEKLDLNFSAIQNTVEVVNIREAVGRYLAFDIFSDLDIPPFSRSVVDGYAVKAADTFGASESIPAFLDVIGSVDMGQDSKLTVKAGQAVYVPTGGMLPDGSDAVVMVEYTELLDQNTCVINKPAAPGMGVMQQGDDVKKDTLVFKAGKRINYKDIGMLTSCGKSQIKVFKKPVVTIVSTGDEIVHPDEFPKAGQIRDINSYALASIAEDVGCYVREIQIINDNFENFKTIIEKDLQDSDLILISGGSSAGAKDMTKDVLNDICPDSVFTHGIALKPGKPTIIANINNKPVFGLPGHPVSAIVVFNTIVVPFIIKHYFNALPQNIKILAQMSSNIHGGEGRTVIQYVNLERDNNVACGFVATPIFAKSGAISQYMSADGFIVLDSQKEGIVKGELIEVTLI